MGNAFSDCYESPDSNHPPPPNVTGRSDLYHASWDPSEAGKYHTDSTRKADDNYNLEADDDAEEKDPRQQPQKQHEKDKDITDPSGPSASERVTSDVNAEDTSAGSHIPAVTESHIARVSTERYNRADDEQSLNQSDGDIINPSTSSKEQDESTAPGETATNTTSK